MNLKHIVNIYEKMECAFFFTHLQLNIAHVHLTIKKKTSLLLMQSALFLNTCLDFNYETREAYKYFRGVFTPNIAQATLSCTVSRFHSMQTTHISSSWTTGTGTGMAAWPKWGQRSRRRFKNLFQVCWQSWFYIWVSL